MTAIEFTPTEERVLAHCFAAKVRTGRFPDAAEVAEATGIEMRALRYAYHKLRAKGVCVAAPAGRRWRKPEDDGLTDRQREILGWIGEYSRREGISPTYREIGEGMGITSPNGVKCHLVALLKKGYLRQAGRNRARAYVLAKEVAA